MNKLAVCFEARNEILPRYAENPIGLIRPRDVVGFQIPLPTSDHGNMLGCIHFFKEFRFDSLAFFQRIFCLILTFRCTAFLHNLNISSYNLIPSGVIVSFNKSIMTLLVFIGKCSCLLPYICKLNMYFLRTILFVTDQSEVRSPIPQSGISSLRSSKSKDRRLKTGVPKLFLLLTPDSRLPTPIHLTLIGFKCFIITFFILTVISYSAAIYPVKYL